MKVKCATCPFGPNGDSAIAASVAARILDASQLCHHPSLHNKRETHLCRGARDLQLTILTAMGLLPEATDAAFAEVSAHYLNRKEPS